MNDNFQTPGKYYDAPNGITGAESMATPSSGLEAVTAGNTGVALGQGGTVDTPASGSIMATPHTAYTTATPGTAFGNFDGMHSGFGNGGFRSTRPNPFETPTHHNGRSKRTKYQASVSNDIEIPDASDLFIAPAPPLPPSMRSAGPSNAGPQGPPGSAHSRHPSNPVIGTQNPIVINSAMGIYQSAECLIKSLEAVCEQTKASLNILLAQANNAMNVYNHCISIPNAEEGKYYWERYIGEIRSQYDSLRDCLWGCVRYLVSRLSVWCKQYKAILPDVVFRRGVAALRTGKILKVEIDKFRYPDWNTMAIARIAFMQNQGNGNMPQRQHQ
jgi:hypothetical protein